MDSASDPRWHQWLHRVALAVERRSEGWIRRGRVARHIETYRGHVGVDGAHLEGRVLADVPRGGPLADDGPWRNLRATFRRFATREVPAVALEVRLGARSARVVTDEEGYYALTLPFVRGEDTPLWTEAEVALADGSLRTRQPLLVVPPEAEFAVVSDLDDTVLHSSITDTLQAAKLTFLHNARTRKPLPGVAALYAALQRGRGAAPRNPIAYVSSSPWNLYELLDQFLTLNDIPHGPIFLRDLGVDAHKLLKSRGHGHKLEHVRTLLARWPTLPFVLIGDSGQEDAQLYARAAVEFPRRIAAIYVRDVDPDLDSPRDALVQQQVAIAAAAGVPMLRVRDSDEIFAHAVAIGLLPRRAEDDVAAETRADLARPSEAEVVAGVTPEARHGN